MSKESDSSSDSDAPVVRKDEDGAEQEEYVVEKILRRRRQGGQYRYFIKWKGYPDEDNSWEPATNLSNCPKLLKEFQARLNKRQSEGKEIDDVELTDEEDEDDMAGAGSADEVDTYDLKEVLYDVLRQADVEDMLSDLPDTLSSPMKCLQKRNWLSDFLIDDTIMFLLKLYKLDQKVVYVPHHHFVRVLKSVENTNNFLSNTVLEFLWHHCAGLADTILVCTSTATGGEMEAEHFALGVIVKLEEKVILLDSMKVSGHGPRKNIFKALHVILAISRKLSEVGRPVETEYIYSRDCPSQANSHDCGVFVLMNVVTLLTRKMVTKDTIRGVMFRRFLYTLMNDRTVSEPPQKKTDPAPDLLLGATKREANHIIKFEEFEIVRKNTNAMIIKLANYLKK